MEFQDYTICHDPAVRRNFPPETKTELVRLACKLPDRVGRSLSLWDCSEIAKELINLQVVDSISPLTVNRVLNNHELKPWRYHYWLRPKAPRDEIFIRHAKEILDLYTRPLDESEVVLSLDEKTSLQPRTRLASTLPAKPGHPVQLEHEYERKGALNLFAALDVRTGHVYGMTKERKRQVEFVQFLEYLNKQISPEITTIHIVCDNLSVHHGEIVQMWLKKLPRLKFHFTPVHCSWMNQIEQWFSILQRKRMKCPNFSSLQDLSTKILKFIEQWNEFAHPFNWTTSSFDKVISKIESTMKQAA